MHLGIIGFGNIAAALVDLLPASVTQVTVLVRPSSAGAARDRASQRTGTPPIAIVTDPQDLVAARPDLVVECAGHSAVAVFAAELLGAGIDVGVVSVGALADAGLHDRLVAAAAAGGARLILPSGAIGGLDLLAALASAGDLEVRYRGTKPPAAWHGTPAETAVDLDALAAPAVFFSGTARQAALAYPKNANVVAALALAGAGFDAVRVELVADPAARTNRHAYEVDSPLCRYRVEIDGAASAGSARTSATTVYSVLREVLGHAAARRART